MIIISDSQFNYNIVDNQFNYNELIKLIYSKENSIIEIQELKDIDSKINKFDINYILQMKNIKYLLNEIFNKTNLSIDFEKEHNNLQEKYNNFKVHFESLNDNEKKENSKNNLIKNIGFKDRLNSYKNSFLYYKNKAIKLKEELKNYINENNISEDIINTHLLYNNKIKINNIF